MSDTKTIELEYIDGMLFNSSTGDLISPDKIKYDNNIRYIINNYEDKAIGVAINPYTRTSLDFLGDIKDYKETKDIYKEIDICNKMFRFDEIVSTALDIQIDFTITNFFIEGIPEPFKNVIDYWTKFLNSKNDIFSNFGLKSLIESMIYEYFISGNVFIWEVWDNVDIDGKVYRLPSELKLVNPRSVIPDRVSFSDNEIKYILSDSPLGSTSDAGSIRESLTLSDFSNNNIRQDAQDVFVNGVLPNELFSHIKRRARNYDVWGIPFLTKIIRAVAYKQKLIDLDVQTLEGMVNYITVFKLGSSNPDSSYHDVKAARLKAFSGLLKNPTASKMLVWPHDIDVITAGPEGEIMKFEPKFKQANDDILRGMGIPSMLFDGTSGTSVSWPSIIALVERLEKSRMKLSNYIIHIINKICKENDIENKNIDIRWSPTNLRDEQTIKTLLLAYYDRGLLPVKTLHEHGGYNHDEMLTVKEFEIDNNYSKIFERPDIPFASKPSDNEGGDGRPVDNVKTSDKPNINESRARIDDLTTVLEDDLNNISGNRTYKKSISYIDEYFNNLQKYINMNPNKLKETKANLVSSIENILNKSIVRSYKDNLITKYLNEFKTDVLDYV